MDSPTRSSSAARRDSGADGRGARGRDRRRRGGDRTKGVDTGQLAKLLEFTPGAQVTQGGLWDFNIGTRGFNRALSRRVAVLLDGRDLSLPFFGYQGWPAFSFPLDDLSGVEIVRGPSAALYGANASGGVISMTSKEPRFSRGGMVRVAVRASWTR